jgi:hypothetical protein
MPLASAGALIGAFAVVWREHGQACWGSSGDRNGLGAGVEALLSADWAGGMFASGERRERLGDSSHHLLKWFPLKRYGVLPARLTLLR